ncbi:hypothetical protein TREMEDRAFT_30526 [Tremella mesenterica DSM 1558]|uniref:uncharacterized protein n=1 Tax=Tremella mesenterica (strain ATCC 24925 / CBS 8224 / DSM 1558 / NBRC 9311 / NRRL Y-6157 / RJB 2259-6 / UBC 559-6) TaxID=578456 RepID=UPI0003F4976A|nr:uncharacterized protein TREMEDRAFT_30526 [Tremella mesenterica DSM 1558]EIW69492.1 hypothetical protein TREMEDRAFT_30526 [Tremella mesenterica DSM 1558]
MSSNPYPPSTSAGTLQAEEFELPPISDSFDRPGPSRPRRTSRAKVYTFHPNHSTSILFAEPEQPVPSPRMRHGHSRSSSYPESPIAMTPRKNIDTFLREEHDFFHGPEEVTVPDFGHMLGFLPDAGEDPFVVAQSIRSRWKRKLFLLMEEPSSGREAFFVHVMVTGSIIFSAILTMLSTLPAFHTDPTSTRALFGLDTTIVVLFTMEYIARSLAHSDSWTQYYRWSTSFFALLDLIAILPYYVEVARNEDTSILFRFSILRTFRLLRVFRAFRYQNQMLLTIEVMYVAVRKSSDALAALSFFILLVLVFFSTLIYFAERGTWDATLGAFVNADGDPSLFDSIPQTAWFALVTMSTVGYGDVVPRSFLGKLLTTPLLLFGLLLIALPSFVLGKNFAIVFDAMAAHQAKHGPSITSSARNSLDRPSSPPLNMMENANGTPLLPLTSEPLPPMAPKNPSTPAAAGPQAQHRTPGPPMRMWDGDADPRNKDRDLTNTKLAKNQLVLLEQIAVLQRALDRQGEMLERLLSIEGVRTRMNANGSLGTERKHRPSGGQQFSLGDSDEEGDR